MEPGLIARRCAKRSIRQLSGAPCALTAECRARDPNPRRGYSTLVSRRRQRLSAHFPQLCAAVRVKCQDRLARRTSTPSPRRSHARRSRRGVVCAAPWRVRRSAPSPSPRVRDACSSASALGTRSRLRPQPIVKMTIMDGGVARRGAPAPSPVRRPRRRARSPIWRSTTTSSRRSRRSATALGVVAHRRRRSRAGGPGKHVAEMEPGRRPRRCAPGSRSRPTARARSCRTLADIPAYGWDYDQSGIVATIAHERDHEGAAEQHFLPAGPVRHPAVARAPVEHRLERAPRRRRARSLALDPDDFVRQLELRFTPKLGEIRSPRGSRPSRSASRSRAGSSASGSRSSATPRISCIRSPARA